MEKLSTDYSLIWGNLRNILDFTQIKIEEDILLVGTIPGEFPVDSYHPIFCELDYDKEKVDLSGRTYSYIPTSWNNRRIITLPKYDYDRTLEEDKLMSSFQAMIQNWGRTLIPDTIPSIVLAIKCCGKYCPEREAQAVKLYAIWYDRVVREFTLDWFEGPLEDCISPEWYLKSSQLKTVEQIYEEIINIRAFLPLWSDSRFSIFIKPKFLKRYLTKYNQMLFHYKWEYEMIYNDFEFFQFDLQVLMDVILDCFYESSNPY